MDHDLQLNLSTLLPDDLKFGERLYSGSNDGFKASDFHRKCDKKGKTFTIIRSQRGNIFGGFTDLEWKSRDNWVKGEKNSFLFALRQNKQFVKLPVKQDSAVEIGDNSSNGPIFGTKDLLLADNCDSQ